MKFFCCLSLTVFFSFSQSYHGYLADFCFQSNVSEWTKAYVDQEGRPGLWKYRDPFCNGTSSLEWLYDPDACVVLNADQNLYTGARVFPSRPVLQNAVELSIFSGSNCFGPVVQTWGGAGCVQKPPPSSSLLSSSPPLHQPSSAVVWESRQCSPNVISVRECSVADCSSSCAAQPTIKNMNVCQPHFIPGGSNATSSGMWTSCTVLSRPPGSSLTGLLPPPSSDASMLTPLFICLVVSVWVALLLF